MEVGFHPRVGMLLTDVLEAAKDRTPSLDWRARVIALLGAAPIDVEQLGA